MNRSTGIYAAVISALILLVGCGASSGPPEGAAEGPVVPAVPAPKVVYPQIVAEYPHDIRAYTQGLLFHEGKLYESLGQYGESALRAFDPATGTEERRKALPRTYFGEGLALVGDSLLYQLTWMEQRCLVHDLKDFRQRAVFAYFGEGWGLTAGATSDSLYMTDGSSWVRMMRPADFTEIARFQVRDDRGPVEELNELEWIDGRLWANIYMTGRIAVIDPATGHVTHYIDCSALEGRITRRPGTDVFNGIAWDAESRRLFVTGKNWDKLFEIEVEL